MLNTIYSAVVFLECFNLKSDAVILGRTYTSSVTYLCLRFRELYESANPHRFPAALCRAKMILAVRKS
jgi:hypothetical protein